MSELTGFAGWFRPDVTQPLVRQSAIAALDACAAIVSALAHDCIRFAGIESGFIPMRRFERRLRFKAGQPRPMRVHA